LGRYNERVNYQHASTLHLFKEIEEKLIRSTSKNGDQQADQSIDQAIANTTIEHDQHTPENDQPSNQDGQIATSATESVTSTKLERVPSVEPTDATSPAYQFITWHDVYAYMRSEGVKVSKGIRVVCNCEICILLQEIGDEFFSNLPVVKLFQHIRADHSTFKKYVV